jgi:hypothetical protein
MYASTLNKIYALYWTEIFFIHNLYSLQSVNITKLTILYCLITYNEIMF